MTTNDVDQFVNKWNGKGIDFDGSYGYQCWDLAAQYSRDVVGLQGGPWQVMPTGPNGGALEVFTVFQNPLPQYYTKIANSPDPNNIPQKGDIVIWNWGTYGHIAVVLGANSTSMTVFEQNSPVGSVSHITNGKSYGGCVGWLRPKNMVTTQPQGGSEVANRDQVNNLYKGILLRDGDQGGLDAYTGKDANYIVSSMLGSQERRSLEQQIDTYKNFHSTYVSQIADLSSRPTKDQLAQLGDALKAEQAKVQAAEKALEEEKAKPPKEVLVHDEETKQNVNKILGLVQTIFNYFAGQYSTFKKYIKK